MYHSFDIMVAVGLPLLILVYCLVTFEFDRKLLSINLEVFPPGWFERGASVNSDPVQAEIIRNSLNSLRIFSVMSIFARIGTNCSLCRRFYQLAALIKDPIKQKQRIYPKHRPSSKAFVLIAIVTVIFVEESIRTSAVACHPHRECVQHARRWIMVNENDLTQCPCLTLIDAHPGGRTYDEWVDPPNVLDKVSQLATSGDLEMLSLVNRRLSKLPKGLRTCSRLRHLYVYASKYDGGIVRLLTFIIRGWSHLILSDKLCEFQIVDVYKYRVATSVDEGVRKARVPVRRTHHYNDMITHQSNEMPTLPMLCSFLIMRMGNIENAINETH